LRKYITDVFNELSENTERTFCGYTIRENMDELARERIYQSVMSSIDERRNGNRQPMRHMPMLRKVSAAAAACLIIASVGAVGVGASKLYKGFADYNPSYTESQKREIEKASFAIGKTISGEGFSITATEGMYDGRKLFVLYDFVADPDKISVAGGSEFGSALYVHLSGDASDTQGISANYRTTLQMNGNKCTQLAVYDVGELSSGKEIAVSATGLCVRYEGSDDAVWIVDRDTVIGEGIGFRVTKGSFGSVFSSESGVTHLGLNAKVNNGYITPWYAQFDLRVDSDNPAIAEAIADEKNCPTFRVVMKDGTSHSGIGGWDGGSGGGAEDQGYCAIFNVRCSFREYVETSEIDHIEINGCKVMLNPA
jgi:hypothetical protein